MGSLVYPCWSSLVYIGCLPLENTQATSLYDLSDESFDNRLFFCMAISPAGQAISDFDSIPELLTALRDAIKAHKSLYIWGEFFTEPAEHPEPPSDSPSPVPRPDAGVSILHPRQQSTRAAQSRDS